jgi:hypothetical protein
MIGFLSSFGVRKCGVLSIEVSDISPTTRMGGRIVIKVGTHLTFVGFLRLINFTEIRSQSSTHLETKLWPVVSISQKRTARCSSKSSSTSETEGMSNEHQKTVSYLPV